MIVPMYKYAFLVYHSNYKDFLKSIRKIGVVHINTKNNELTPEMQELFRHLSDVEKTAEKLEVTGIEKKGLNHNFKNGDEVYRRLKTIEKDTENNQQKILQLEKEKKLLLPWGDFEWDNIRKLEEQGIKVKFMSCPSRKYESEWEEQYYLKPVAEVEGYHYFLKIERDKDIEDDGFEEKTGSDEAVLPESSLSEVDAEIDRLKNENESFVHEIHHIAFENKPLIRKYIEELHQEISEQNALLQTTEEVEGRVKLLEGWVPETKKEELDNYLEENKILYTSDKAEGEDKVPILLKNNRFARVYEVIGELYDLPNHREIDLVPFFAPFYMMFFGFSLGDAGYGLILIVAAQFLKKKMPNLKSIFTLAQWLGLATVIFGTLTGTFFGVRLGDLNVPFLQRMKEYMLDTDQLFNLALILGAVQILFGMFIKVFNITRVEGFMYSLSTIGWLVLLLGLGAVYGLETGGIISSEVAKVALIAVLSVAGVLILLLNNPKRNPLINFGAGWWDVYGMATGLLGDLLSYIRLFALGISSSILGMVFNSMAMTIKPDIIIIGPLVMIIILVIGHSITIFMSGLGAFVHPIRLTFVEFYKNAGFMGGGKPYQPFAEPASKK